MSAPHEAAAPVETGRQEEQAERGRPPAGRRLGIQRYAILIVFACLVAGFGAAIPSTFLSIGNLSNILGSQAVLFILVMAVLLPTIMGDFVDLSLGSSLGMSAMTLAVLNVQHGTPGSYLSSFSTLAQLPDLYISEIKALIFGFLAGIIAAYRGLNPRPGPKGVGDAVNESVVIAFVLLFVVNVVLTAIYLQVVPAKGA